VDGKVGTVNGIGRTLHGKMTLGAPCAAAAVVELDAAAVVLPVVVVGVEENTLPNVDDTAEPPDIEPRRVTTVSLSL